MGLVPPHRISRRLDEVARRLVRGRVRRAQLGIVHGMGAAGIFGGYTVELID
jgi:hypothetical protein